MTAPVIQAARPDPLVGSDLGPYRIESVIGRGGMGVVYLATDTGLDRRVALKVLSPTYGDDEVIRARFVREAKLAASTDHPNIIPVYDAGQIDGTSYLAMRYVEGTDLATRLRAGPLEPWAAVPILAQVAAALDAAHVAGLVHRDVKPANVLIAAGVGADHTDHAYLTDFGLTKQRDAHSSLTRAGGFLGTLEYVAPEQIEGREIDGQADQYALAAVAVDCLTGQPPFPRDSDLAVINAHLRDGPPSLHDRQAAIPAAADAVISRAMAKEPSARYPDCESFVDALRAALGVGATEPPARPARTRGQRRLVGIGLIGAAIVGAILLAAALHGASGGSPAPSLASSLAAGADPGPSVTGSPGVGGSPSVFPSADEQAALALVPEGFRSTCVRGRGVADAIEAGFTGRVGLDLGGVWPPYLAPVRPPEPNASLTCTPGAGADRVHYLWYRVPFRTGVIIGTSEALSLFAIRHGAPEGDCSKDDRALTRWSNEDGGSGAMVCLRTAPFDGSPWLDWAYAKDHMLALATRDDRDYDALFRWFESLRPFLP